MSDKAVQSVRRLAQEFATRGWLPATSGNISVLSNRDGIQFCITRSGADKQRLTDADVLLVDAQGLVVGETSFRPSAETLVHAKLYEKLPSCGSIVHVHTVYNNVVSARHGNEGYVTFANHELLKALDHWELNATIQLPIVENFHNLVDLATAVEKAANVDVPGVLVRNHGIYAWGADAAAAQRHLEAFEFLFHYHMLLQPY